MNSKVTALLKNPALLLVWALICGLAYLSIVSRFVQRFTNTAAGGNIIIWIFFPAIMCGAALILIKLVKQAQEKENERGVLSLFYAHLIIIVMGIAFFAERFV